MTNWIIRQLNKSDLSSHIDDFVAIAADVPNEYWGSENFLCDLPEKWNLSFGAWDQDRPVGYAIISQRNRKRAHLHHFMVSKEIRGLGLGGKLLQTVRDHCKASGFESLSLKVIKDNHGAREFYARHGFSQEADDNEYVTLISSLPPAVS